MKKNKEELKLKPYKNEEKEVFCIFQMPDDEAGLRKEPLGFQKSEMVSPMEGRYTKDVKYIPDKDIHEDIDDAYDVFRVNPKLTKEEEIAKHGVLYHEFPDVSGHFGSADYDKEIENNRKVVTEEQKIEFGFGITDLNKPSKPRVLFEEPEEMVEEDKDPEIDNLTFEELHIFEPKVKEAPVIYSDEPKTIILGKKGEESYLQLEKYPQIEKQEVREEVEQEFKEENIQVEPLDEDTFVREDDILQTTLVEKEKEEDVYIEKKEYKPEVIQKDLYENYKYPPMSLLEPLNEQSTEEPGWIPEKIEIINQTLADFGIEGSVVAYTHGPQVTRYEVRLGSGVNVKKITQINETMMMNLCAISIRIEAPIPGKNNVGIEVPNQEVRTVQFRELTDAPEFMAKPLNIALGLDIDGKPVFANIAKMPHGLIAGKTGSGKSVCVNSLLVSLLIKNTPNDLKLILVDPKKVEMTAYSDLPHLLTPVITDPKLANEALKWACDEMDRRYNIFSSYRVRDIITYNEKIKNEKGMQKMPYIVIFIDELSDLMITCGGDVENSIKRITQLGRASGIHAIVATQRPTIDVIKGTIKANIPTRIAFSVKSYTDSTTVLDQSGAETLLGHGDMLFQDGIVMRRLQGPYLTDNEIANVTDYIRGNYGPDYKFTHEDLQEKTKQEYGASDEEDMELVFAVAMEFAECQMCSINSMQKKFSLGFNRGQKIVEILEKMGVVSPKKGTQGRDVLMDTEQVKEVFHRK